MIRTASASPPLQQRLVKNLLSIQLPLPFSVSFFGMIVICLASFTGCNTEPEVAQQSNEPPGEAQVTPAVKKIPTTSVTPDKTEVATSPAAAANELPPTDADPAEICQRFMDLLKSGNRIAAENLLTRAALTTTSKAGLQLEPMGGPTATYEVKATRFATIENKLAQVDCEIVELVDGNEVRSQLTWLVRKQKMGWRVAGLLLSIEPDVPKDLLSFENIQDVEKIKNLAAREVLGDPETRQAAAPNDASKLK
jgi:hypothetical protein